MLDYSIVIPVFNKSAFTKRCLESLTLTIGDAGRGEVIVIDNASTDETPEMLKAFPWVRVVRNERNVGFAGANNQGAQLANGRLLLLLNNDTEAHPGWLDRMLETAADSTVGVVGARLLFPNNTVQHAGVVVGPVFFSRLNFVAHHINYKAVGDDPRVVGVRDVSIVTGACLLTPRNLYLRLGGLDEAFWNGYEDVDYCLKVRREGLRVVYDGRASLYHFESQSGAQRFRKTIWNSEILRERWPDGVPFDDAMESLRQGTPRHMVRFMRRIDFPPINIPSVTVIVHGVRTAEDLGELESRLRSTTVVPIEDVVFASSPRDLDFVNDALRIRGLRYAVFIDAATEPLDGWLEELIVQVETHAGCAAATYSPALPIGQNVRALAPDARCTVFSLEKFPAHLHLRPFESWNGIVADFALQALPLRVGTRGASRVIANVPPLDEDRSFQATHGFPLAELHRDGRVEVLATRASRPRGLVSIVTLSWNAPAYTKIALDSIREHTSEPYEVIVVDNGSGKETLEMLRAIDDPHVRVIYNPFNRGFAGGNNDGLAVARGEHAIVLNNDVVVTEGWVDRLLAPFGRIPSIGVTAPRSNKVAGHQVVYDAIYEDGAGMHAYAAERAREYRGRGYLSDRAIGFCLCISRTVLDQVGGFDESFGAGNFEDDDYCLRVRAAGYKIYICDDAFIHHFGSQSFAANNVDYAASMHGNWAIFAKKWGYPAAYPVNGYQPIEAVRRGFDREKHFIPFAPQDASASPKSPLAIFWARVATDTDWGGIAPFVRRYLNAFTAKDAVELHLTLGPDADPETIARRVERAAKKAGVALDALPDIVIGDEEPLERRYDIAQIEDASPSALRRLVGRSD